MTIPAVDRIAFLEIGDCPIATQDELLALDGLYARLHMMRFAEDIVLEPFTARCSHVSIAGGIPA